MTVLLAIGLLLLTPLIMVIIRLVKPGFAYFWLVAAAGSLIAWPLVLLAGNDLPYSIPLLAWQPGNLFSTSPTLLVDSLSWPYAVSVASLAAAVILTAVARLPYVNWRAWGATLVLGGLGILAVLAGNPLTLLLAWAALDLAELLILMLLVNPSAIRERIVIAFSVRAGGILLLLWADIIGRTQGMPLNFDSIPISANIFLLLAAGLRLGVLPLHIPFFNEIPLRRGLGTMLRLTPVAASLVLLTRAAINGIPESISPLLTFLTALAALYSAALWAAAKDELSGRHFWLLGMASLSVAAALKAEPTASLAWGLSLLLPGGLIFLFSARRPRMLPVLMLGALAISALPLTPAWDAMRLYSPPFHPLMPVFLLAHILLLVGYFRHALRPGDSLAGSERWVWVLYPLGLILPLIAFLISWFKTGLNLSNLPVTAWMGGLITVSLAALLWNQSSRIPALPKPMLNRMNTFLSLHWLYSPAWVIFKSTGWLVARVTELLEGDGGVLWALVMLAILFSLISQSGFGN